MNRSEYHRKKAAIERALNDLKSAAAIRDLPEELSAIIMSARAEVKAFDVEKYRLPPVVLEGEILSRDQVLAMVKEKTERTSWRHNYDEPQYDAGDIEHICELYNVDSTGAQKYKFYRDARSRDETWLIEVFAFPGHLYIRIHTGRVTFDCAGILPIATAARFLAVEAS